MERTVFPSDNFENMPCIGRSSWPQRTTDSALQIPSAPRGRKCLRLESGGRKPLAVPWRLRVGPLVPRSERIPAEGCQGGTGPPHRPPYVRTRRLWALRGEMVASATPWEGRGTNPGSNVEREQLTGVTDISFPDHHHVSTDLGSRWANGKTWEDWLVSSKMPSKPSRLPAPRISNTRRIPMSLRRMRRRLWNRSQLLPVQERRERLHRWRMMRQMRSRRVGMQ